MIEAIRPSVYIKGSEYAQEDQDVTGKIVDERLAVERGGGRIVFTDDVVHSSSSLINQFMDIHDPPLQDYLNRLRGTNRLKTCWRPWTRWRTAGSCWSATPSWTSTTTFNRWANRPRKT